MADTQRSGDLAAADDGLGPEAVAPARGPRRRRRGLRITLLSLASVIVLIGAVVAGSFAYVNHEVGSISRVQVNFLVTDNPAKGMTILLTDTGTGPTGLAAAQAKAAQGKSARAKAAQAELSQAAGAASGASGLIMLLHINADHKAGGAVSISPLTVVNVPGHGKLQIQNVIAVGGPSLLVKTLEKVTGVAINHYTRVDFTHVSAMIKAEGGVSVTLPRAEVSLGHHFRKGVNQINGAEALAYARAPGVTETGRVLRQQSLTRAVLSKLGDKHLLINPLTATRVLHALTSMLTVDSTLTNAKVEGLAADLGHLTGSASTYVSAPTKTVHGSVVLQPAESTALWTAITNGKLAAFAKKYPKTVTPTAP